MRRAIVVDGRVSMAWKLSDVVGDANVARLWPLGRQKAEGQVYWGEIM